MQLLDRTIAIENFNNDFLLLKSEESLIEIGQAIFKENFDFIEEVIVTEHEICLSLNSLFDKKSIEALHSIQKIDTSQVQHYTLPVWFTDHEDWTQIMSITGFSKEEIIKKLCHRKLTVGMFGFLPGFLYISGLDSSLHVPRKTNPSKYIEKNSLAIGGKYLGLYPVDSPGGWHIIGKTPLTILQSKQIPPIPLQLGDTLQLKAITKQEYDQLLLEKTTLIQYNG